MNVPKRESLATFMTAVGAVGVAGLVARVCPAGCTSCTTCWSALLPAGSAVASLGIAVAGSAAIRARLARHNRERADDLPRDRT
jgi:hypothetical protein